MSYYKKYTSVPITIILLGCYFLFAFFLERTSFYLLLTLWTSLFTFSYILFIQYKDHSNLLVSVAFLARLVFLFAIPNLSQDFYRFIWDGRMLFEGLNPYLTLPETFIQHNNFPVNDALELYNGMGAMNGSHYTNYPPINQLCFYIAALFSNESILGAVVVMRLLIISADIGIYIYGKKLLKALNLPISNIFLYILNPFIIIELTGNLHFESVMLFFLVIGLYLLHRKKWFFSSIMFALSISVKLIPLFFLPLFYQFFTREKTSFSAGIKKLLAFYFILLITTFLLFSPFVSLDFIANYSNSVGLWFRNFEFNASIYYVAREIGYLFRGYNEIAVIGKIMPTIAVISLLIFTFYKRSRFQTQELIVAMLLSLSVYYFTTTTMHPWYLASLLLLSLFTKYKFPLVWSIIIILSYQAYANTPWKENLWLISIEYAILYLYFFIELKKAPSLLKIH